MINMRLLLIPLCLLLFQLAMMQQMYPIALNSNGLFGQDPAYQYLFAGVDILIGNSPGHTDHPGTPLQTLIAIVIPIAWGLSRLIGLTELTPLNTVLSNPEFFLAATSCTLLVGTTLATYYFGRQVFKITGQYPLAISCQTTPLIFSAVSPHVIYPTPEAALFLISTLLAGALTPFVLATSGGNVTQASSKTAIYRALVVGALCGLGFAVKVTFAPMIGLLLLLTNLRLICLGALAMLVTWLIGVLPIIKKIPQMFKWFYQVFSHTGTHGHGSAGLINFPEFKLHILWLIAVFPLFFYVFAAAILVSLLYISKRIYQRHSASISSDLSFKDFWIPSVLLVVAVAQVVMVAKHVGASYMVPALPLPILCAAWLLHNQPVIHPNVALNKYLAWVWLVFLCAVMVASSTKAYTMVRDNHARGVASFEIIQNELERFKDPLVIGTFNCNFQDCALWFGMLLVPVMELRMDRFTPNFFHFDIFNKRLHIPGRGEVSSDEATRIVEGLIQQGRPVLLISPAYPQLAQFLLTPVVNTQIQNLYRVKGIARKAP
jgi:hypothetical protein